MGGGGGGDAYDADYNDRMAGVAETYMTWGQEMQNFYKYGVTYDPYEVSKNKIGTTKKWIPEVSGTVVDDPKKLKYAQDSWDFKVQEYQTQGMTPDEAAEAANKELGMNGRPISPEEAAGSYNTPGVGPGKWVTEDVYEEGRMGDLKGYDFDNPPPSYMTLEQERTRANLDVLPMETEAYKKELELKGLALDEAKKYVPQYGALYGSFLEESSKGLDPNTEALKAKADVQQSFKGALDEGTRALARRGVTALDSGAGISAVRDVSLARAKAEGGAAAAARRYAEEESLKRKGAALQVNPMRGVA